MAVAAPAPAPSPALGSASPRKKPLFYYGYYLVGVALVTQFVSSGTQAYTAGVFLRPMTEDLDWTRGDYTLAQTVGRFLMAGVGFFVGVHVDKGRARGLMVMGGAVLGCGLMLVSAMQDVTIFGLHISTLWQWIVLKGLVFTVGAALIGNLVVNVTLSKWWVDRRGRMIGISSMGVSLSGVILPWIMVQFVDAHGWRAGWQLLAVLSWALVLPAAMMMRSTPEQYGLNPDGKSDEEMASPRGNSVRADFANSLTRNQALRTSALYMIVIAFGFSGVGLGTMLLHTIPFMTDAGFSRSTASLSLTLLAIPAAFTKPIWGWLMDYLSAKVLAAASFILAAVAMLLIVFGAAAGSLPILFVGFVLVGSGIGGQIPIQETIWASYFGRRYLGQVRSVAMPFALVLGAGGPWVVAAYFDSVGNYNGAFLGIGVMWAIAAGLVLLVRRPSVQGSAPPAGAATPATPAPPATPPARAAAALVAPPSGGAPPAERARAPIGTTSWSAWVTPQAFANGGNGANGTARRTPSSLGYARPSNGVPRAVPAEVAPAGRAAPRGPVQGGPVQGGPVRGHGAYGLAPEGAEDASTQPRPVNTRNYMGRGDTSGRNGGGNGSGPARGG